jgi:hypothetical protein
VDAQGRLGLERHDTRIPHAPSLTSPTNPTAQSIIERADRLALQTQLGATITPG